MLEEFEHDISDLTLVPSEGGVFEVEVDGRAIYSKKATGTHPDLDDLLATIRASR